MKTEPGVDLYSSKILIQKGSKEIMPEYLRFVKGIIDSEEIPLNISRETIPEQRAHRQDQKARGEKAAGAPGGDQGQEARAVPRHLEEFQQELQGRARSATSTTGKNWRQLLLFSSSKTSGDELIDLKQYVGRMPEGAEGDLLPGRHATARRSKKTRPWRSSARRTTKSCYLLDPLDEFVLDHLREYDKKALQDGRKRRHSPGGKGRGRRRGHCQGRRRT